MTVFEIATNFIITLFPGASVLLFLLISRRQDIKAFEKQLAIRVGDSQKSYDIMVGMIPVLENIIRCILPKSTSSNEANNNVGEQLFDSGSEYERARPAPEATGHAAASISGL